MDQQDEVLSVSSNLSWNSKSQFQLWTDEHSFTSAVKHRQTPWATVQITGKIYVYADFIPNDQKDKNEGTTGLPSLEVMVLKNKSPEILT